MGYETQAKHFSFQGCAKTPPLPMMSKAQASPQTQILYTMYSNYTFQAPEINENIYQLGNFYVASVLNKYHLKEKLNL